MPGLGGLRRFLPLGDVMSVSGSGDDALLLGERDRRFDSYGSYV